MPIRKATRKQDRKQAVPTDDELRETAFLDGAYMALTDDEIKTYMRHMGRIGQDKCWSAIARNKTFGSWPERRQRYLARRKNHSS
jgi:hypothetical protein